MNKEQQRAVCMVVEADPVPDGQRKQGTGYLVAPTLVVTCQHVVARTQRWGWVALHFFEGPSVWANLREAVAGHDVAILELSAPIEGVSSLPLGERLDGHAPWEGFGYPRTAGGDSLRMAGIVDLPDHHINRQPRMVLSCNEAGDPIFGWSGSPVLIEGQVVGHVAGFTEKPDDPSRPAHGKVYAVPVALVRGAMQVGDLPPPPSPFGAFLHDLLQQTRHVELQGFRSQAGMGKKTLSCEIAQLWTPIYGTPIRLADADEARDPEIGPGHPERFEARLVTDLLHQGRRLLIEGQPGFGKTTFMKLVAGALARDGLGRALAHEGSARAGQLAWPAGDPWEVPIFLPLRTLAGKLRTVQSTRALLPDLLLEAAVPDGASLSLARERKALHDALCRGEAALLLDGLDEVSSQAEREQVFLLLARAVKEWPSARVVVTSRPFSTEKLLALGFAPTTLKPFGRAQIQAFLDHWVTAVPGADRAYRGELEKAIVERREIEELAQNPVMLTCLCVVHWNERRTLPRGRAAAYKAVFHWLMEARADDRWEKFPHDGLADYGLPAVALAMMAHREGKQASMSFAEAARDPRVAEALADVKIGEGAVRWGRVETWLRWECAGSGVIQQEEASSFRFWHLTFQELLAADALSELTLDPSGDKAWPLLRERLFDTQWKETMELFPACLHMRAPKAVGGFFDKVLGLLGAQSSLAEEAKMAALLHRLLVPLGAYSYVRPDRIQRAYEGLLEKVKGIFEKDGARKVRWRDRLAVAEALGEAGDFRLEGSPVDRMLEVPGNKGFVLGKYPVTVQEYAMFVRAGGYEQEGYWVVGSDREGWSIREKTGWKEPACWEEQQKTVNRPVVGVSCYEAQAYCAWLSERSGEGVRLPTNEEWTAASTNPGGPYPWGREEPTEEHANFGGKVGSVTPVGLYPLGASPGGHLDLAGNVREWSVEKMSTERQSSLSGRAPLRALRGGGYDYDAVFLRSDYQDYRVVATGRRDLGLGFRLALSPASLGD